MPSLLHTLTGPVLREYSTRDVLRALRGAFVFMAAFLAGLAMGHPQEAVFAAFSAHSIALVDVEGPYVLRLNLLCLLTLAFTVSAVLGTLAAGSLVAAMAVTAVLGLSVGAWRQLCRDYGPSAAVPCALILFTALGMSPLRTPASVLGPMAVNHALATLLGGLFGVVCLLAYWPLRPQYPLRRLVGRNWVELASLARAIRLSLGKDAGAGERRAVAQSARLRTTLDAALSQLDPLQDPDQHPFWNNLAALNLEAARFATRLTALRALWHGQPQLPETADLSDALEQLATTCNTVAHATIKPRPGSLRIAGVAMAEARGRLAQAERALEATAGPSDTARRTAALLRETNDRWTAVEKALRQVSRPWAGRAAFRAELRHVARWAVRPLSGAFSWRQRIDPALVRYTLGLTFLLVAATALFKGLGLVHGSWLPFSMLVVLQPSARFTRSRMAHRVLGTVVAATVAGLPFWAALPLPGLLTVIGVSCFVFTYLMRRHYGTAVFCITVTVILMTGLDQTLPWQLALERLGCVVVGSLAAWLLAKTVWPGPSQARLQNLLDAAIDANRAYLAVVRNALATGSSRLHQASVAAKRLAERAQGRLDAALAEGSAGPASAVDASFRARVAFSPRLTDMLTVLFLQQETAPLPPDDPEVRTAAEAAMAALDALSRTPPVNPETAAACREAAPSTPDGAEQGWPPALRNRRSPEGRDAVRVLRDIAAAAWAANGKSVAPRLP